jgi:hypothetical protein
MDETSIILTQELAETKKGFTKAEVNFLKYPIRSLGNGMTGYRKRWNVQNLGSAIDNITIK